MIFTNQIRLRTNQKENLYICTYLVVIICIVYFSYVLNVQHIEVKLSILFNLEPKLDKK